MWWSLWATRPSPRRTVRSSPGWSNRAGRGVIAQRGVLERLRGQAELSCTSGQSARASELADSIAKRIEREGRWRPVPALDSRGPGAGSGVALDGVLADEITHTHTTPLGPSLVGWQAWQRLGMPALLENLGFNPAQQQAAAVSVINRLVDPGSELALLDCKRYGGCLLCRRAEARVEWQE